MDQAAALWAALEAAASLGDAKLDPPRVEALAGALGLERERLPALVSQLQKSGKVAIGWGGVVEVLPEQATGAGVVFNLQGTNVGPGAAFAGRDARGGANQACRSRRSGRLEPWPRSSSACKAPGPASATRRRQPRTRPSRS